MKGIISLTYMAMAVAAASAIVCCSGAGTAADTGGICRNLAKETSAEIVIDTSLQIDSDGFIINGTPGNRSISAKTLTGAMYGGFALRRLQQTGRDGGNLDIREEPWYERRILNHWDNLDNSVERGYAGPSIWNWGKRLPRRLIREYAVRNAEIGINGSVLNNVNASPEILSERHLCRVRDIADILRPYGIRVYLSVNFSSPSALGGLPTSDPLDPEVREWWKAKAEQIYGLIPDFGGFLVKANSEGLPGPQDFGRTHADGANMLADAMAPYGGIVMWRAFVYSPDGGDRASQACNEFKPLDGEFRDNVLIQVKNGPVDFQPREPFSPLFGQMERTALMPELQITQEYLGFSNHLVYLGPLFKELLDSETWSSPQGGPGASVAMVTGGRTRPDVYGTSAIAGVANTGRGKYMCGHPLAGASWFAFGRLAWNPGLDCEEIASEWLAGQKRGRKALFEEKGRDRILGIMMSSRETAVDYMMPLGLHHLFAWEHHYGPEPWCDVPGAREDWMPRYYHRADSAGLGFDRSLSGSGNVGQYREPLASAFNDPRLCPEELLLWFHHLPWDFRMKSGRTLWEELCHHYSRGVEQVGEYRKTWEDLKPLVDRKVWKDVRKRLKVQEIDACWWRDACIQYFAGFSRMEACEGAEQRRHSLGQLMEIHISEKQAIDFGRHPDRHVLGK